jgi:hypothetical protein
MFAGASRMEPPMEKVSEKLGDLLETKPPDEHFKLNVMLRAEVRSDRVQAVAAELANLADGHRVEALPLSRMVLMSGNVAAVRKIATHPSVEWVDCDAEAPIEELMDS